MNILPLNDQFQCLTDAPKVSKASVIVLGRRQVAPQIKNTKNDS